ncbi:class I SAM-dependent methyltransferase [Roseibium sp. RKSG952]|uniref:class I SAM-dependent methyltransferase n=1 Tax=Roseibium sp. RKSG952 TaxID=2529384 RepID=UPI0012BB6C02|nr:class I SAM-dependent methyltransferase [Roseibium sp. RKSG952]MTH96780.1 methyltransferase domain-containing protein [Roseibium sp. RKSG952]
MSPETPRGAMRDTEELARSYSLARRFQHARGVELIQLAAPQSGETVLDLGCGTGDFLPAFKARVGEAGEVIAADPDTARLEIAREVMETQGLDIRLMAASAADLKGVASNSVDLVFSNYVLHWVLDTSGMLAEVVRVLRPGGRFVFECVGDLVDGGVTDLMKFMPDYDSFYAEHRFLTTGQWLVEFTRAGLRADRFEWLDLVLDFADLDTAFDWMKATSHGAFSSEMLSGAQMDAVRTKYPGPVAFPFTGLLAVLTK